MLVAMLCGACADIKPPPPIFAELDALDTTADPACAGTWIAAVTGQIVDEAGTGVAGAFPQMCVYLADGRLTCLMPEIAREDGYFAQIIGEESRCMSELSFRVFQPDGEFGTTYCQSEMRVDDGILTLREPLVLYEVAPARDLPPEGDPEAIRTVTIADGLEIDVVPARLFGMYSRLGGARITGLTCFSDVPLDGLYALTPESLTYRLSEGAGGFSFRMPTDLPEGARVDLLVLGGLDSFELSTGARLREGALEVFGTGTVRDGMVVNDPGSELPYLSWLGYRLR